MAGKKTHYDLAELRNIPILDVCEHLGLQVEKRGRNFWCKVRSESRASVILHTDTNYFYDFGNGEHGNNIDLVQYATGISDGKAIRKLANAFHISPSETKEDRLSKPMNLWEYKKIGLYGDMATKNLIFPVTSATVDELLEMEYAYRMPMNQLKIQEPDIYRQILISKAIPFVQNKRERFFLSVWNHYCFLRMMNRHTYFFESEKTAAKFAAETKDLEQAERALYKACLGTDILQQEPTPYDPQRVLSHMLQGRVEVSIGPVRPDELYALSRTTAATVCGQVVSYDAYCRADTDDHLHAAVLVKDDVMLSYPEEEKAYFTRLFCASQARATRLEDRLQEAHSRKSTVNIHNNEKTAEPVH